MLSKGRKGVPLDTPFCISSPVTWRVRAIECPRLSPLRREPLTVNIAALHEPLPAERLRTGADRRRGDHPALRQRQDVPRPRLRGQAAPGRQGVPRVPAGRRPREKGLWPGVGGPCPSCPPGDLSCGLCGGRLPAGAWNGDLYRSSDQKPTPHLGHKHLPCEATRSGLCPPFPNKTLVEVEWGRG